VNDLFLPNIDELYQRNPPFGDLKTLIVTSIEDEDAKNVILLALRLGDNELAEIMTALLFNGRATVMGMNLDVSSRQHTYTLYCLFMNQKLKEKN